MNKKGEQGRKGLEEMNMSFEQVKQEVLAMVDKGVNYREISKRLFNIGGLSKRFSISQISKFVKERDRPVEEDEGSLAARAFQLFEERKGAVQAVVELKIKPEDAEKYYSKWVTLKENDLSAPSTPRRLRELEEKIECIPALISSQLNELLPEGEGIGDDEVWVFLFSIRHINAMVSRAYPKSSV